MRGPGRSLWGCEILFSATWVILTQLWLIAMFFPSTHLCRMDPSTLTRWTDSFPYKECLVTFYSYRVLQQFLS